MLQPLSEFLIGGLESWYRDLSKAWQIAIFTVLVPMAAAAIISLVRFTKRFLDSRKHKVFVDLGIETGWAELHHALGSGQAERKFEEFSCLAATIVNKNEASISLQRANIVVKARRFLLIPGKKTFTPEPNGPGLEGEITRFPLLSFCKRISCATI